MNLDILRTRLPLCVYLWTRARVRALAKGVLADVMKSMGMPGACTAHRLAQFAPAAKGPMRNAWEERHPSPSPIVLDGLPNGTVLRIRFRPPTAMPEDPNGAFPFLTVDGMDAERAEALSQTVASGFKVYSLTKEHAQLAAAAASSALLGGEDGGLRGFLRQQWTLKRRTAVELEGIHHGLVDGRSLIILPPLDMTSANPLPPRFLLVRNKERRVDRAATRNVLLAIFTALGAPEEIDRGLDGRLPP